MNFEIRYHPEGSNAENAMWKQHIYVYLICCLYCYQKHVFMNLGGICDSFINPTPYLEMGYFLPFFYTENAPNIDELIFFLQTATFFLFVLFIVREKCMFNVKIKCLCLKYLEIDLEKCPKYQNFS